MSETVPPSEAMLRWWTNLENDWQAVCLGLLLLLAVSLGVSIPW
ncbi:hypothetical protein [Haladaptatus sp. DYF46]|nr:hypothetical protein [Haladaptatus sp. DYF46]